MKDDPNKGTVDGLALKNVVIDGKNTVDDLVVLFGRCPGLVLENVQLQGFNRSAIKLSNCAGTATRPIKFDHVRTIGGKDKDADVALIFEISTKMQGSPDTNQYIQVSDCRFEGRYKSAVQFNGPVADVKFSGNRFFQLRDGFLYRTKRDSGDPIIPRHRLHLSVESNTFCQLSGAALRLEALPLTDDGSQIALKNNLFTRTALLAQVDDYSDVLMKQPATAAKWIWFNEEKGDPLKDAPPGSRYFRKAFVLPNVPVTRATLDIAADEGFAVWLNGKPLGQRAFNRHVYSVDVAEVIRPGNNVLAIEGKNAKGPPGLLAQLTITPGGAAIVTDKTWKASRTLPPDWEKLEFNDAAWPAAKELIPYGDAKVAKWQNLVWDSLVPEQLEVAAKPILSIVIGNIRDPESKQGNLALAVKEMAFELPTDPATDTTFLRYPKESPLATAGHGNTAVGALPKE